MLGSNQPSTFTPLGIAQQRQQQSRVTRGGFGTSEVANTEGFEACYPNTHQISPSPAEQPLPPLIQPPNYTETMAPKTNSRPESKKTTRQMELQITTLKKEVSDKDKKIQDLNKEVTTLTENGEEREARIQELLESIRGKKGKKNRKAEQKQDVKTAVRDFVKGNLFRTIKFAAPGDELTSATKKVWAGIKGKNRLDKKGPNKLTEEEFVEIYDSFVSTILSEQRQYVQTRTSQCVKGKCHGKFGLNLHQMMPGDMLHTLNSAC